MDDLDLAPAVAALERQPGGVLAGAWGAALHGLPVDGPLDPPVVLPPARRVVTVVRGLPVLPVPALLTSLAPAASEVQRVVLVDHAVREGLATLEELVVGTGPGTRLLRRAARLHDPRCASPLETRTHVAVRLSHLGPVDLQVRLCAGGHPYDGRLRRGQVWWECDGLAFHAWSEIAGSPERTRFVADRRQQSAVAALRGGQRVLRPVWEDVWPHPLPLVASFRAAVAGGTGPKARDLRRRELPAEVPHRTAVRLRLAWSVPGGPQHDTLVREWARLCGGA